MYPNIKFLGVTNTWEFKFLLIKNVDIVSYTIMVVPKCLAKKWKTLFGWDIMIVKSLFHKPQSKEETTELKISNLS